MSVEDGIKEVSDMLVSLKEAQAGQEKKTDGLLKEQEEKLVKLICDKVELAQKEASELNARLNEIESGLDQPKSKKDGSVEKDQKAFELFLKNRDSGSIEIKTMRTDSDPAGGYLVLPEFDKEFSKKINESSPMRELATVKQGISDTYMRPLDVGRGTARWVAQGSAGAVTTTSEFGMLKIEAHKMEALPDLTVEALEDPYVNLESWLASQTGEEMALLEATAFVSGNGVGKPKGILSYTAGTSTYAVDAVEQVNSGSSGAVTVDGYIDVQNALKEPYQAGSVWLMKRATFGATLKLKSTSNYHFLGLQPTDRGSFSMNILGAPVKFADDMSTIGANSLSVAYGNFKKAYTIYDRLGTSVLKDPYSAKGTVIYYTTKRVGGGVVNFEAFKIMKLA
jgi:HK97 family phage major capsid protein